MAIKKVDGLGWELPPGGRSEEARQRTLYENEKGIGVNLAESEQGRKDKSHRETMVLRALGIAADKIEELKKKAVTETELNEADLTPVASEIRRLKSNLRRMTVKAELQEMSTNPSAVRGLKYTLQEKKGLKDLAGTLSLIERFQEGSLSAEKLLKELEGKGVFNFS